MWVLWTPVATVSRIYISLKLSHLSSEKNVSCGLISPSTIDCRNQLQKWTLLAGRALAQAVSRRLPTAAIRVRAQVRSCGICGGQSGTGAGFIRVVPFPLPVLIPPTDPHSSSSGAGTIGQLVANVPSGLSHPTPKKLKKSLLAGTRGCRACVDYCYFIESKLQHLCYRSCTRLWDSSLLS
jgi:hypothetical protein